MWIIWTLKSTEQRLNMYILKSETYFCISREHYFRYVKSNIMVGEEEVIIEKQYKTFLDLYWQAILASIIFPEEATLTALLNLQKNSFQNEAKTRFELTFCDSKILERSEFWLCWCASCCPCPLTWRWLLSIYLFCLLVFKRFLENLYQRNQSSTKPLQWFWR